MGQHDNSTPTNLRYDHRAMAALRRELREELVELMEAKMDTLSTAIGAAKSSAEQGIKTAKEEASEAKTIGLAARKKAYEPHECTQTPVIEELKESIGTWSKWWRGIMITIMGAIIVFGGAVAGWWYSHTAVKDEVTSLGEDVGEVKAAVKQSSVKLDAFQQAYARERDEDKVESQQHVQAIAEAVGKAVKKELKNSRRR